MNTKTPEALIAEIGQTVASMQGDMTKINATLKESVDKVGSEATKAIGEANALAEKVQAQAATITEIQQKLADGVKNQTVAPETLGQLVVKTEAYTNFAARKSQKMVVEANTIIGQDGSPPTSDPTLVQPQRLPGIIPGAFRNLRIRDLLPAGVLGSNSLEFARELAFTNDAAGVAEGAQKPESDLTFELKTLPVRTIAHFIKASKQILTDATALASYIDTRMQYGVDLAYENQIVNGDGDGQNLSGMLDTGNHTVFTPETGDTILDSLNRMIEQVALADYDATGIIMNTADWHAVERLKDGELRYLVGNPLSPISRVLWGLPVAISNTVPQGTGIVGNFNIAYQVWNRMGTIVEMFEQDADNVQKNLVTIRAELRGLLASYRPTSVRAGLLQQA